MTFDPPVRPIDETLHDVLPDAVPLPPRLLTQVTCDTPTLSDADPPMVMVADVVEYEDALVGLVIVTEGAVPSGATIDHVNVWTDDSDSSRAVRVTLYVPTVVGVPAMKPFADCSVRPGGSPVAVYVSGCPSGSSASNCRLTACPTTVERSETAAKVGDMLL